MAAEPNNSAVSYMAKPEFACVQDIRLESPFPSKGRWLFRPFQNLSRLARPATHMLLKLQRYELVINGMAMIHST
jgi:hypothetical protein